MAQPGSVRDALAREIAACDTYVGLFDRRRGTVPKGSEEDRSRAITEEEFALARERGLRCLVFLSRAAAVDREPGLNDFLEAEVTEYSSGLWTRPYDDQAALRREIAAGLAALRPRVVLALAPGAEGLEAKLFLGGVAPAWPKEAVLGPVPVQLDLSSTSRQVLDLFRRGAESRNRLKEDAIRFLGQELGSAALPDGLGEALAEVLDLAAHFHQLVTLEVRTADPAALALPWELVSLPRHPLPVQEGLVEIVRRIPGPGEPVDPIEDTAATIPAGHLSILGFTAAPVEDEAFEARLGTGGFGASELFWEKEQEQLLVALEGLLRERRGRLILPDTGETEDLRHRLAQADRPQVVHISCHGSVLREKDGDAEPVLLLEDAEGRRAPLQADDLLAWIRSAPGEAPEIALLVLAACSTAGAVGEGGPAPGHRAVVEAAEAREVDEATGLAETLVRGGLLRVLGMQSTVSDRGATAFAAAFYARLSDGADLSLALRAGRVEIAARGQAHEWAVPTLTTRCDAGPLVAPKGSAPPVAHPFEAVRGAFEIEGISYLDAGYVGRRETERRLRRAFEQDRLIAIHGLGGIGKSTLAARFLERRETEGWKVLILYAGRELAPATVFEEVATKLGLARPAGVPPEQAEELLRQEMKEALRAEPSVLFLDNFEDNQDGDGNLKNPELGKALLELARLGGERFRLLFTSRHRVHLGPGPLKVRSIDLGELSPSGCRKLRQLPRFEEIGKLPEETWQRALLHFGGHPKALELLEGFLREQPDRARQLLADMGSAVAAVGEDLKAEQQDKGRKLLVENVLATVPAERRPAFDRLCLLETPLPTEELETLLAAEGLATPAGDLGWLRDHGFLARTVAPSALTGGDAVHRLLASRQQEALAEREGAEVVRGWHLRVAEHLVQDGKPLSNFGIAAGHRDAAGDRVGALELYDNWAIRLRNRHAYFASLQVAKEGLRLFPIRNDDSEQVGAANLWISVHDAFQPLGRLEEARRALDTALGFLVDGVSPEALFTRAITLTWQGSLLWRDGSLREALERFEAARAGFEEGGHHRERAIVLGYVARLLARGGDVAGALKLHEERLSIFEQLGDVRERAVTLGDVAQLRAQGGDVSGALKLFEEKLTIFEQLGNVRERAVTLGDVARLRAEGGDVSGALKLFEEKLTIVEQLGDVRERAVTLGDVARLRAQEGDVAGALKLHEEMLSISRHLGDIDAIANAQYNLADLDLRQGTGARLWSGSANLGIFSAIIAVPTVSPSLASSTANSSPRPILRAPWRSSEPPETPFSCSGGPPRSTRWMS